MTERFGYTFTVFAQNNGLMILLVVITIIYLWARVSWLRWCIGGFIVFYLYDHRVDPRYGQFKYMKRIGAGLNYVGERTFLGSGKNVLILLCVAVLLSEFMVKLMPVGRRGVKGVALFFLSIVLFFYEFIDRGGSDMKARKKVKTGKPVSSTLAVQETVSNQALVTDAEGINPQEAREAASGPLKSLLYQKRRQREVANLKVGVGIDETMTEAVRAKTERIQATKELLRESGQIDQLPERERKEEGLEDMKLDTEMMRQKKEQAELAQQLKELEKDESPPLSQVEMYAKATEEEQKKLEHQLAMQAMQEMMVLKRMTEQARYLLEWQEEIREKYPDMAEDIIDAFERLQTESD